MIETDPAARGGRTTMMVKVGPGGDVTDAQMVQNGAKLPKDAVQCMTSALRNARFTAPGTSSTLTIPMTLAVRDAAF